MNVFKELKSRKNYIVLFFSFLIMFLGLLPFLFGIFLISQSINNSEDLAMSLSFIFMGLIVIIMGYMLSFIMARVSIKEDTKKKIIETEKRNIIRNMKNLREATEDEKKEFIKIHQDFNIMLKYIIYFLILLMIIAGLFILSLPFYFYLIIIAIFLLLLFKSINNSKKEFHKQENCKIYIADCHVYDTKFEEYIEPDRIILFVKITDGNYLVNTWFNATHALNYSSTSNNSITIGSKVKLFLSDELDIFDIIFI